MGATIEAQGKLRIELDGLVTVVDGAVRLTLVEEGLCTVDEGQGHLGIELYGFIVVMHGTIHLALADVSQAPIVHGRGGKWRIELQDLIEILDGPIEVGLVEIGNPAIEV